jgi:hypothetical protein
MNGGAGLRFLSLVGRHASLVLLVGMGVVALLPGVSALLRPALPALVSLVLGLAIARLDMGAVLRDIVDPKKGARLLVLVFLFLPLTALLLVLLARLAGAGQGIVLLVLVFGAAPPISSAASLSLLLGYDARTTLQVSLLATILAPFLGPMCFALASVDADVDLFGMSIRIAAMIAGGFAIGLGLQRVIGKEMIGAHAMAFNGAVALSMLLFLFPLLDGVSANVVAAPLQSVGLLVLALCLNFGGNFLVRRIAWPISGPATAEALGLMFGNRNVSFYLAVLPFNPMLSVFVAAAQIPIYATPALFRARWARPGK